MHFAFCTILAAFPVPHDTLPNGLGTLAFEDHHLPMVVLRFTCRAGSAADPAGQDGIANLVGTLLTRGTASRSAVAINREIEYVGGQLSANVDNDHATIDLKVLTKDLDQALNLLSDMVLHPAFSDSEIARARRENRGEIQRLADEPGQVLYDAYYRLLFGAYPYAHPVIGYDSTLARLTRAQILAFYSKWFVPGNCYICAAGDFSPDSLKAKLAARFGAWPRKVVPVLVVPELPPITEIRGKVINRPEMNQAYIFLGHYGTREGAPDIFATRLMNYRLGSGGLTSRVGLAVRVKRGLAYDARTFFDRMLLTGAFAASTQTRTDSAGVAIELILAEIKRMRDEGVGQAELDTARDYYIGNFPLEYQGLSAKVGVMDRVELEHLGLDYLDTFAAKMKHVTTADVLKAAQDHLFPDKYLLVVVGNLTEQDIKIPGIKWIKEP